MGDHLVDAIAFLALVVTPLLLAYGLVTGII